MGVYAFFLDSQNSSGLPCIALFSSFIALNRLKLSFVSMHFARVDHQDRAQWKNYKSVEVIWRGSYTFGSSSQIFANAFPVHYSPSTGFHFEVDDDSDNPLLFDYNVEQRVNDFINAAMTQANVTRTNHTMWTMGNDFQYQYAETWFREMDKLIHYVNKDGRVNALYSTPSMYTDAKSAAKEPCPLKIDDYFLYADNQNAYWTGFFTSRSAFKRFVWKLGGYYLAARQLELLVRKRSNGPNTFNLSQVYSNVHYPLLVPLKVTHGPLVEEVYQQFNEWIYQVTKLYKDKEHAEIEFTIGPIPLDDGVRKEIITRPTANMVTEKVRDFREDWNLTVTQPVAGNYYPADDRRQFQRSRRSP